MGLVQVSTTCGAEVVDRMEMGWDGVVKDSIRVGKGGGGEFNEIIQSLDFVCIEMNHLYPQANKPLNSDGVARVAREVRALQLLQLDLVLAQLVAGGKAVQHVVGLL